MGIDQTMEILCREVTELQGGFLQGQPLLPGQMGNPGYLR